MPRQKLITVKPPLLRTSFTPYITPSYSGQFLQEQTLLVTPCYSGHIFLTCPTFNSGQSNEMLVHLNIIQFILLNY